MTPEAYFKSNQLVSKKRYDALHDFFVNKLSADEVAKKHGYTLASFYSQVRDFRKHLKKRPDDDYFFKDTVKGRKPSKRNALRDLVISLRKKNHSAQDIVTIANSKSFDVSYWPVFKILREEGFARLPRRCAAVKKQLELPPIKAPVAEQLEFEPEKFHSSNTGLFSFLPVIYKYGIHQVIERSAYPFTRSISKIWPNKTSSKSCSLPSVAEAIRC